MLNNPAEYERDISSAKFTEISQKVSPDSCWHLPGSSGGRIRNDKNSNGDAQLIRKWANARDALYDTTL
jgi:hypothetical protein